MLKVNENNQFELAGITWKVLDHTEEGAVCIGDKIRTMIFGDNNDWRESRIRKYLNGEFLEKIESEIGAGNVIEFERNLLSVDGLDDYETCMDKVSIINIDEYRKYRKQLPKTDRYWWMCTPDSTPSNGDSSWVAVVSPSGHVYYNRYHRALGVRPFCIFSSCIFESGEK